MLARLTLLPAFIEGLVKCGIMSLLKRLAIAGAWVSGGVLLGRLAGFFREATIAANFGVSATADLVVLLLSLPDVLSSVLIGGALSMVLIPEFTRLSEGQARRLFYQVSLVAGVVFGMIAVLLGVGARPILQLLAPGLAQEATHLVSLPVMIVVWVVPLTVLAGVTTSYLQANNRFAIPAMGTLIFNLILVAGLALLPRTPDALPKLALVAVAAALVRWLSQLLVRPRRQSQLPEPTGWLVGWPLFVRYLQAFSAGSLLLLLPVVTRALASLGEPGAIASVNYAVKLVELPLGAGLTVFAVVLFPTLSQAFANASDERGAVLLRRGIATVVALALAMTVPLVWFSSELTALVFGWGDMTPLALERIGFLAALGFLSLPAQAVSSLLLATYNAKRDTRTPMLISLIALGLLILLGGWMQRIASAAGVMGALVVLYWVVLVLQLICLQRRHGLPVWRWLCRPAMLALVAIMLALFVPVALLSRVWQGPLAALALSALGFVLLTAAAAAMDRAARTFVVNFWRRRRHA